MGLGERNTSNVYEAVSFVYVSCAFNGSADAM